MTVAISRTTVTLDRDVQLLLKKAMRKRDVSFKQALNDAVRVGLAATPPAPATAWEPPIFDMGELLVRTRSLNALSDEIEAQEQIAKLQRGA